MTAGGGDRRGGPVRVAPSILSADFANLQRDIAAVERGGADLIHVDVMDGHFVPNITMGPPVVKAIKRVATRPLDVHLMIDAPERYVGDFVRAGADMLSVHVEAARHLHSTLALIRSHGIKTGAVLNPSTPVAALEDVLHDLDFVVVMSVNPGFGGQAFIPRALDKLRRLRQMLDEVGSSALLEVDGGIDTITAPEVVAAGASILVAGHAIFSSRDPEAATRLLRAACASPASTHA